MNCFRTFSTQNKGPKGGNKTTGSSDIFQQILNWSAPIYICLNVCTNFDIIFETLNSWHSAKFNHLGESEHNGTFVENNIQRKHLNCLEK